MKIKCCDKPRIVIVDELLEVCDYCGHTEWISNRRTKKKEVK